MRSIGWGLGVALLAGSAQAAEVVFSDVVARVVVIPEARADVAVDVQPGRASMPPVKVKTAGGRTILEGGTPVNWCSSNRNGTSVRTRSFRKLDLADAPLITIRAPQTVSLSGRNSGLQGRVGPSRNLSLNMGGCSNWTVGDVADALTLDLSGGAQVSAGRAQRGRFEASGGGVIRAGALGELQADGSGGGSIRVASVSGPVSADASGGGNIEIEGGRTGLLDAEASGGGWVSHKGAAERLRADASGGGRVRVAQVTGGIDRQSESGGGSVTVGR